MQPSIIPSLNNAGRVSTSNGGGFIQMSVALSNQLPEGLSTVDASSFKGIELDVFSPRTEEYNLHLRTPVCERPFSAYRATFRTEVIVLAARFPT